MGPCYLAVRKVNGVFGIMAAGSAGTLDAFRAAVSQDGGDIYIRLSQVIDFVLMLPLDDPLWKESGYGDRLTQMGLKAGRYEAAMQAAVQGARIDNNPGRYVLIDNATGDEVARIAAIPIPDPGPDDPAK